MLTSKTPLRRYVYSHLSMSNTVEPLAVNWRPFTLRTPFLSAFIVLCVILLLLVEPTIRSCLPPQGCPIVGEPSPSTVISNTAAFVYNYLPTAIAIVLGLIWAVVHHDYMRMEPWFQLSKAEGAAAEPSLCLMYPYTFPPLVAIKAGKARYAGRSRAHPHTYTQYGAFSHKL
jgi:hypothetical protein